MKKTKKTLKLLGYLYGLIALALLVAGHFQLVPSAIGVFHAMASPAMRGDLISTARVVPNGMRTVSQGKPGNLMMPGTDYALTVDSDFRNANTNVIPDEIVVGVNSAAGAGAAVTTVFLFQQDLLQNITDNGSGANSITYNYLDTYAGRLISEVISRARAAIGQIIYGYSITFTVASTAANNPSALNSCNPKWTDANCYGDSVPYNASTAINHTRKDFDTAIAVVTQIKNSARQSQFSLQMAIDSNASVCFYTHPGFSV